MIASGLYIKSRSVNAGIFGEQWRTPKIPGSSLITYGDELCCGGSWCRNPFDLVACASDVLLQAVNEVLSEADLSKIYATATHIV